ncbi:MAG: hypothetical protein A2157_01360 [Deltaproteobacteria bacterium RBG_16_47_11]|nr:MAG: hypothetical protein A2157_01360 [Deltaproteobacteria bacterium RBG_16_47_11]
MGVMIRSFPPHPNPLPQGRGEAIHPPSRAVGVFWHIFINNSTEPISSTSDGWLYLLPQIFNARYL